MENFTIFVFKFKKRNRKTKILSAIKSRKINKTKVKMFGEA